MEARVLMALCALGALLCQVRKFVPLQLLTEMSGFMPISVQFEVHLLSFGRSVKAEWSNGGSN